MDASKPAQTATPVLSPNPPAAAPAPVLPSVLAAELRRAAASRQSAIRIWMRDFRRGA